MNLTDLEKEEVEKLGKKYPVVKKLCDILQDYEVDPAKIFYSESSQMVIALSKDMKKIREGNTKLMILGADKDDKTFERIKSLITDSEKIFKGLEKGKKDLGMKQEEEEEDGRSRIDRLADKKRTD